MLNRWNDWIMRAPGSRLAGHALLALIIWIVLTFVNQVVDTQLSYYLALAAMYATAMFGMTILVGLSGQVSLGNGAIMAVGAYTFALTTMNWTTVPILGAPMNAVWGLVFAGFAGVTAGAIIGALGARLRGPYLAGLTLGVAVGVPSIVNRFPSLLGGDEGLKLIVPYPEGGYPDASESEQIVDDSALEEFFIEEETSEPSAGVDEGVAEDDMLTVDDAESGVAEDDMLTVDDAQSGVAEDDFLTLDDAESGVVLDEVPVDTGDDAGVTDLAIDPIAVDSDFILQQWQASVAIAVACIVGFVALNLVRGRQGRVWQAVRDDPVAAAVVGIAPSGSKVSAFVVSALFAALAGGVFAQILTFVGSGAFALGLSLSLLVGVVLGGRLSLVGAILGAVILVWLPEFVDALSQDRGWPDQITNNAPNLLYGLLVVAVVLVAPGGITGGLGTLVGRLRKKSSASG